MRTRRTLPRLRRYGMPPLIAGLLVGIAMLPALGQEEPTEITLLHDTHLHGSFGDAEPAEAACPDGADPAGFEDVADTNVHLDNIDCAVASGVVRGTSAEPLAFSPGRSVTRGQVATMLAGSLEASGVSLQADAEQPFPDAGDTHDGAIAALAAEGIIDGFEDGMFRPQREVRRDQLASLLVGAIEFALHEELSGDGPQFDDVAEDNPHGANILAAREIGVMQGRTADTFNPGGDARRDQAATTVVGLIDHVLPTGPSTVNIARYMALVDQLKDGNPNARFVGNGDDIAPSLLASVFHGEHMIEALNASPLDYNTLGNHEFDFGPDNARERIEEGDGFQWVSANVRDIDDPDAPFAADLGVELYSTEEIGGVTVGFTGLGPEEIETVTSLTREGDDSGATHVPMIEAMDEVIPMMQDAGADIIVVASHLCGSDARDLAQEFEEIDAIVGDHCAEVLDEPELINGTLVSLAGDEFDWLAELTLEVDADGDVADHSFTLHDVTHVRAGDPDIQAIVDSWEAQLDAALGEVIGFRVNDWDVRTTEVRSGETGFANYIVDAMRESVDADVAITNGGGIRSDHVYPGGEDIELRDVQAILPFGNTVVMVELSGATILEALEWGVQEGTVQGRFPQVSGMTYVWDPDAPAGDRIVEVTVDGEPLDEDATYTLATNDFMLGGGDGYDMLDDGTTIISPDGAQLMMDAVVERIEADGDVEVETDGRISTVD